MKETNRARQAFEDYYFMGPGRSIRKLHQTYIKYASEKPPTIHLRTLLEWSTVHGWQERVKQRDQEIADAKQQEIIETATKTGYAIYQNRIHALGELAAKIFELIIIPEFATTRRGIVPALIREFRGLLADIAAELGEREKKHRIKVDVGQKLLELMRENGLTYGDIQNDTLLSDLFNTAGIPIVGVTPDGAVSGEEVRS